MLTPLTIPVRYSTGQIPTYKSGAADVLTIRYAKLPGLKNINTYAGTLYNSPATGSRFSCKDLNLDIQGAYSNGSYFEETRSVMPDMYWAERRDEDEILNLYIP